MARDCCSFVRRQAQPAPRTAQEEGCTARKATSTHRRRCHGLAYKHLNRLAHGPASCGSVEHLQGAVPQSSRLLLNLCWVPAPPPGVENMDDTEPLPQARGCRASPEARTLPSPVRRCAAPASAQGPHRHFSLQRKRRSRKRDRPEASGAGGEDVDAAVAEAPAASQGQPDGRDAASTRINTTDHKEEDGPEELPLYRSAQVTTGQRRAPDSWASREGRLRAVLAAHPIKASSPPARRKAHTRHARPLVSTRRCPATSSSIWTTRPTCRFTHGARTSRKLSRAQPWECSTT